LEYRIASDDAYGLIERVLSARQYGMLSKVEKLSGFLRKITGLSRAQINRLITRGKRTRHVVRQSSPARPRFPRLYTAADVALLAETDAAQDDLSGPAVRRLFRRSQEVFGDSRYRRLANISVSHLYNLRRSTGYRRQRVKVQPTQPRKISIGKHYSRRLSY